MTIYTGKTPPANSDIIHCASEDLRRMVGVAAKELARRNGDSTRYVLEELAKDAED